VAATAGRSTARAHFDGTIALLLAVIAAAWAFSAWAEATGVATLLHHHTLYHSGLPFWRAALLLLAGWQAMTAAMMLPSSLPLIRLYVFTARGKPGFPVAFSLFLLGYFTVWSGFALVAFAGDMRLHLLVHTWSWLAAHSQIIPVATLGLAAVYQVTPLRDACLRKCRHPAAYLRRYYQRGALGGLRLGLGHSVFCVGCCWALMLVMFAAGVAHLFWMGVLAIVMLAEKTFPRGDRLVGPVAVGLSALAACVLLLPGSVPGL
jgi:predicted metal-binding membrane protein